MPLVAPQYIFNRKTRVAREMDNFLWRRRVAVGDVLHYICRYRGADGRPEIYRCACIDNIDIGTSQNSN